MYTQSITDSYIYIYVQILDRISLQYAPNANERTLHTNDTKNARNERTNHWSVTIDDPMTNDPGSIETQYSMVLLFQ